jgi:Na+/H+ antiporter NhaD/arsenite permease-like protein
MISSRAIATLVLFVVSAIFVVHPVSILLPRIWGRRLRLPIGLTTAPIVTIVILWATKCIGPTVLRDGIVGTTIKPYNIMLLFFSLAYITISLDSTGVLQAAAVWVSCKGGFNGRRLYLYFYILLSALSIIIGNDPVILSGTFFLVYYTNMLNLDPIPWLISEFAAANTASMVLFVGNPTNVVICEGFAINNLAFSAYTIFPFIACTAGCYAALRWQFRDPIFIPKRLAPAGQELQVNAFIRDRVGALVGAALFICCLIVIFVASFFGIDVWKISLPFAVAKFIFDLSWDSYLFSRRKKQGFVSSGRGCGDAAAADAFSVAPPDPESGRTLDAGHDEKPRPSNNPSVEAPHSMTLEEPAEIKEPAASIPPPSEEPKPHLDAKVSVDIYPKDQPRSRIQVLFIQIQDSLHARFPTFMSTFPRLPFALVPFAFSQFILVESLAYQGWISIFARWLVIAGGRHMDRTLWVVGVIGVVLCNISGTNIGATILLSQVIRAAASEPSQGLPYYTVRAAAIALAVASNISAVGFAFSASLAGLLWKNILRQKGIQIGMGTFAYWNMVPIFTMTSLGMAVVSAEMAVLYKEAK